MSMIIIDYDSNFDLLSYLSEMSTDDRILNFFLLIIEFEWNSTDDRFWIKFRLIIVFFVEFLLNIYYECNLIDDRLWVKFQLITDFEWNFDTQSFWVKTLVLNWHFDWWSILSKFSNINQFRMKFRLIDFL